MMRSYFPLFLVTSQSVSLGENYAFSLLSSLVHHASQQNRKSWSYHTRLITTNLFREPRPSWNDNLWFIIKILHTIHWTKHVLGPSWTNLNLHLGKKVNFVRSYYVLHLTLQKEIKIEAQKSPQDHR